MECCGNQCGFSAADSLQKQQDQYRAPTAGCGFSGFPGQAAAAWVTELLPRRRLLADRLQRPELGDRAQLV
jgi:hypothetical protein